MINISNPAAKHKKSPMSWQAFFDFAFRPFFLIGSLFSVVSLILWNGALKGDISIDVYGGILWWHMHEMLFGFVPAIIVGFLLTAVQNWTGVRSLNGKGLAVLMLVWLLARIAMFLPSVLPMWLIASIDLVFLPVSAIALAQPIIKVKLWRNLMFIPILLVMAACNAMMHYSVLNQDPMIVTKATTAMVLLVTLVMSIMGGRVFPMFTANGTQTAKVAGLPWLEKAAISSTVIAVILGFNIANVAPLIIATVFILSGCLHALRVFRWKFSVTLKTPLVWSLHLSYWSIALGLVLFGLSQVTTLVTVSQAIHTLTVGAMGTMILSMISRVSLGHTGRNIVVGKTMTYAFVAIILSFIVRVFGSYVFTDYNQVLSLAVLLWVIAYGCFIALYLPILTRPRV